LSRASSASLKILLEELSSGFAQLRLVECALRVIGCIDVASCSSPVHEHFASSTYHCRYEIDVEGVVGIMGWICVADWAYFKITRQKVAGYVVDKIAAVRE
jgi:hypothetical protein